MNLPHTETLALAEREGVLRLTLDRPARKNAMNELMLLELLEVFAAVNATEELRAVVLRGAGGTFCAGADIKDLAETKSDAESRTDPMRAAALRNRRFGQVTTAANALRVPLIGVIEGAVMGGGFGLACVTDIALARADAKFALPETGLGLVPAQIAPFVVQRIGLTQARRLMLTGARIDGMQAERLGLVHAAFESTDALETELTAVLGQIKRCGPRANAATKALIMRVVEQEIDPILDHAAELFAEASLSEEGREGALAFVDKRLPHWAQ